MKRLNWIDDIALPLAIAVLTADWLSLWVRWLARYAVPDARPPAPTPSPLILVLLMTAGVWVTRSALGRPHDPTGRLRRDPGGRVRRVVTLCGFAALLLTLWLTYGARFPLDYLRGLADWGRAVPPEFVALTASAYLWWRGIAVGQRQIPHADLERAFYGGIVALALLLGVDQVSGLISSAEAFGSVLAFFATGLSALALASFERARRQQKEATGSSLALNRYWLATVAGVIGVVLVSGLAVAELVAPETLTRFVALLRPLIDLLSALLLVLLAAVLYVVFWLAEPILTLLARAIRHILETFKFPSLPEPAGVSAQRLVEAILNSPLVRTTTRGLSLLLLLGIIAVIFYLAVRRFHLTSGAEIDETRESIVSRDLLLAQLKNLLSRLRPQRPTLPPLPYLALVGPPDDPRLIIRRAYQSMLDWAQSLGFPRAAGQTPITYAEALARALPVSEAPIQILTRAYVSARYGADVPPLEEAKHAEKALADLLAHAMTTPSPSITGR